MNRNEFFQALTVTKLSFRLTSATLEICTDDPFALLSRIKSAPMISKTSM